MVARRQGYGALACPSSGKWLRFVARKAQKISKYLHRQPAGEPRANTNPVVTAINACKAKREGGSEYLLRTA